MSTTWEDVQWEMAHEEEAWQETVKEIKEEAIVEFGEERYVAFYKKNPEMHLMTLSILDEAATLLSNKHLSASVVFSFIAVENILKNLILQPLLWGTFIDEEVAGFIIDSILNNRLDQMSKIIFHFVEEDIGSDIRTMIRPKQTTPLWKEVEELRLLRNRIVHKGVRCDENSAARALEVTKYLFNEIFIRLLDSAGFRLDEDNQIIEKK